MAIDANQQQWIDILGPLGAGQYYDTSGHAVQTAVTPEDIQAEADYQKALNYTPEEYQAALAQNATYLTPGGVGGFGGFMNQNFNAANLSQYVEPINRYVGPLVLPTVMAIGGGIVGGGLAGAALAGTALGGTTAGGAIAGAAQGLGASTFNTINQAEQGNTGGAILGALGSAATGGIGGALGATGSSALGAAAGEIPIGSSLAEMEALYPQVYGSIAQDAGLNTIANGTGPGLIYGSPEFYAAGNDLGLTSQQTGSLANTSLGGQSAMGLSGLPITYGSPEMIEQGQDLGLTPSETTSLNNTALGGVSANQLATGDTLASDAMSKFAKGLMSGSNKANTALPTFQTNFTPLSSQAFGNTGNSWGTNKAGLATSGLSAFTESPFKGSFLMNSQDKDNLTSYLADYLPLNASKKMKDFSSFLA